MFKILTFIFIGLFVLGCTSATFKQNPDQYFSLLGVSTESKIFEAFTQQLEIQEMPQMSRQFSNDEFKALEFYDTSLMFSQNGIELLLKNKKVVQVKLYMPDPEVYFANYSGHKLPLGILQDDNEAQVTKKLGSNKNTNTNPARDVREFEVENASVAIDNSTGKILYIALFQQSPDTH